MALDMNGKQVTIGARVEISPRFDLWMRGAKYGTVTKAGVNPQFFMVRMDHLRGMRKHIYCFSSDDLKIV